MPIRTVDEEGKRGRFLAFMCNLRMIMRMFGFRSVEIAVGSHTGSLM